jgi:integrase
MTQPFGQKNWRLQAMTSIAYETVEPTVRLAPVPFSQFKAEMMAEYKPPIVSKVTGSQMKRMLEALAALTVTEQDGTQRPVETTADLTTSLVVTYLASRPPETSPWTLRGNLATIRTICMRAVACGYLRVSPFSLRKLSRWIGPLPPPGRGKKRHCSREEIRRVLNMMAFDVSARSPGWSQWQARRLQAAFAIAVYCGMRRSEILRLHAADVDLDARVIYIRPRGKALKTHAAAAPIAIPSALMPILTSWAAHRNDRPFGCPLPKECPWFFPTMNRKGPWVNGSRGSKPIHRLQAVAKRVGVEPISWQMCRRSCATHLEHHGVGRATIKRVLRHTNERTSEEFYSESDITNILASMDGFDF